MAITLKTIRDLIKTKVQAIKYDNNIPIFVNVYDYAMGDFKTYPSAVILPVSADGEIISTKENKRLFKFEVSMYQEVTPSGKTPSEVNSVMTTAIDKFIEAFDRDKNLDYGVDYIKVVKMDFDFRAQTGPFVFAKFEVECEVLVQNYS